MASASKETSSDAPGSEGAPARRSAARTASAKESSSTKRASASRGEQGLKGSSTKDSAASETSRESQESRGSGRSAPRRSSREDRDADERDDALQDPPPRRRMGLRQVTREAVEQLAELLGPGAQLSSVSAVKRTDDGWSADIEIVELEKIPDTSSLMATYRVALDEEGELMGYERVGRYTKGNVDRG